MQAKIPDPDAVKPDDWDEDAPRQIVDEVRACRSRPYHTLWGLRNSVSENPPPWFSPQQPLEKPCGKRRVDGTASAQAIVR